MARRFDVPDLEPEEQLDAEAVKVWRKAMRRELLAQRLAIGDADHTRWSAAIHDHLSRSFRNVAGATISFYCPYQREFDVGPLMLHLLASGATCALPVVVATRRPLVFRRWELDTPMAPGVYDIPVPVGTEEVVPQVVIAPLNGFDALGFRLGYGSAYFDRTLAALENGPTTVGVGFELARLDTIYPQPHDIPFDFIVTELGVLRTSAGGHRLDGVTKVSPYFVPELEVESIHS